MELNWKTTWKDVEYATSVIVMWEQRVALRLDSKVEISTVSFVRIAAVARLSEKRRQTFTHRCQRPRPCLSLKLARRKITDVHVSLLSWKAKRWNKFECVYGQLTYIRRVLKNPERHHILQHTTMNEKKLQSKFISEIMIIKTNIAPFRSTSLGDYLDVVELCQFRIKVTDYEVISRLRINVDHKHIPSNNLIAHLHVLLQHNKVHYWMRKNYIKCGILYIECAL